MVLITDCWTNNMSFNCKTVTKTEIRLSLDFDLLSI